MTEIAFYAIGGVLFGAAMLVVVRIIRGPSVLDRVVATDVLVSIVVCALGVEAALARHSTTLPILISLSLVGFVGSVAVARFVARDRDTQPSEAAAPPGGRTLTSEGMVGPGSEEDRPHEGGSGDDVSADGRPS